MDFHSLKRKKLQSLCKKHGIPANKTNLQMADLLTATLAPKEKGNLILVEDINERNSEDEQKNCKKVRFSPDIETREYEPSGYKKEAKRTRRTSTLATSSLKESIGNRRGRGNGKTKSVSRTRQPQAKADKEVSSVTESDVVENVDGGEARMVGRRSTRIGAKFRDYDLVNIGVVNRNTRSKAQSVVTISAIERKDEVFGATVKTSSEGVARATSKRNSVSHLDVSVESRQVVLKESRKRQKVMNLDVVTDDKASSETDEQNEKAPPPAANLRVARRKSIVLNPNNVAEESTSDKAMLKLKQLHEKGTRKENDVVQELRRSNRRASVYGENEKALPPAANLLAARRKSIVLNPNNVAEESASDEAVEKLKPLHEKAIQKENNVVKELRRSNRRASVYGGVTMSTEVNKIAGKVAQVKDRSESVQKAETTTVVSESLFAKPSRVSSRHASKMEQKAITGVSIMTTETAHDICQSSEKFAAINDDSVLDTGNDGIIKGGADDQCGSSEKCANFERNLEEFQAKEWDTEDMPDGADKRSNKMQKDDVENDRVSGIERLEDESTDEVQLEMETPNTKESFQADCKTFLHFNKDNTQAVENKETVAFGGNACDASELTASNQAELEDGKGIFEFVREEKDMNRRQHDFASGEALTFPPILLSSSGKCVVHKPTEISSCVDSYCEGPEMELLHSPKQPNGQASYEQLDGEMEEDEIIMGGDGRVQITDEGAKNPKDNPSLGNDAKDHDEVAIEQLNAHSNAFSEGASIDDDGILELSCENKTEIQPMEAGREQCPSELGDEVVTVANSKPTVDTKNLDAISPFKGKTSDAVGDSSCHESEAFELNLFSEEGESTVEKAYPVILGSFAEMSSTVSNVKEEYTANFIVEEPQVTEQFEEMKKTEAVMVDQSHAITTFAVHQDSEFTAEVERTIEEDGVISGVERNNQDGRVDEEEPGQLGQEAHHRNASLVVGAETIMADTQDMSDDANAYPNKMQRNHVESDRFSDLERTKYDESTDEVQLEVEAANAKDRLEDFASSEALAYNPSLGDDARDHDEVANEQLNVHSDALSEEIFIDNTGFPNELACENKTVIQPIEAEREQCLPDAVSPFKGNTSDAVGDSPFHESEAFELNLFFEGGDYVVEKQAVETSPLNLVSMDAGSFQEHASSTLIAEEASDLKEGHTANSVVEELQEVTEQFEETGKTDVVMINQATATHQGINFSTVEVETANTKDSVQVDCKTFLHFEKYNIQAAEDKETVALWGNARDPSEPTGNNFQADFASGEALTYHETTRFSFNGEENDVPEEKQANALPQSFMDELEDGKVSYIAVAKNTSDKICEKDVVDGMGKTCAREVGDSDVGEPLLSEAMDAPSFLELSSYQLNSYEDNHLTIHVESTFFTNRKDKVPSDSNLTSNNLEEAMHVEENHCEESEFALEDNLKSDGLGCTELSEDNAACIERFKQDMQLDNSPLPGTDKPTYIGARGDISTINQEFVDLQNSKDNIAADSSNQSIAIYDPDILSEQANISHCGDQGISENEVCEKHKDSRVATGKINVLQEAATYKAFDGQLEDEIIRTDDGRVQESDEVANNPTDNPSSGDDARDHDEVANEQHNTHSNILSEEVFSDNSFLNELSCENETEIQPTEAGREQCLPELGDRETAANSEQMVDIKKLDAAVSPFKGKTAEAVVDFSCHEGEAFELISIFEEGEYVAEKQDIEAFPLNLVSMVDGSVPEKKTEIQPTEAGREHCLSELGDRETAANSEQMVDTNKLDAAVSPFKRNTAEAVVDSSCHESEAFDLNSIFEEGEYVAEKQVSMVDGSVPENKTEIQPTEAGREQCLPEFGDRILTAANYEQLVDAKNLDAVLPFKGKTTEAVGDSSCHETEAFELNLFFEEGEHVVEKQGVEAFPANLVSMDGGSFPENVSSTLIDEEAERGYTANSIVEGVQEVTEQFEEMQTTEAVMADQPHALAVSGVHQEVTAEEGKSCELKLQSAKQTSDHTENDKHNVCCESLSFSAMKRTSGSDLISRTPQKFAEPSAMKENAPSLKIEQHTSLTASRMSQKRRPLKDLRN